MGRPGTVGGNVSCVVSTVIGSDAWLGLLALPWASTATTVYVWVEPAVRPVSVNDAEGYMALALQGFGLVQAARFMAIPHIEKGELVEILSQWKPAPLPISVLYPQNRHLSPKVRAFADWAADLFAQCPLLSGKDEDYDPSLCTFGGKPPESTTQRDIIEQRNVAESVL